jgi:hypothetical protein
VILFDIGGVESENAKGTTLGEGDGAGANQNREEAKGKKAKHHAGTFPG